MKLVFVVNDVMTEKDDYTTLRLAHKAINKDHEVALVSLDAFSYENDSVVSALSARPSGRSYKNDAELLSDLQDKKNGQHRINLNDWDAVMLRADPADELVQRPWAPSSGLLFAQLTALQGTLVLNNPFKLTDASNKTYFQQYPRAIRPRTVITRDEFLIKQFIENEGGKAVIKPLQGSGGQGVFIVTENTGANLNQIIEATVRDGYAIVQEYLPKAADGDLRMITLNGQPLQVNGVYACCRRYNDSEDVRNNFSAGGSINLVTPDKEALEVARLAGPKLKQDGMYFAGLDIVGDKMMEVNVDSAGCLNLLEDLSDCDFSGAVIDDIFHKVDLARHYGKMFTQNQLASL